MPTWLCSRGVGGGSPPLGTNPCQSVGVTNTADQRDECERWFVRQGLPHLIDHYSVTEDVFTRATPFLALVMFSEVFLSFGDRWKGWAQLGAFLVGLAVMAAVFAVANRLRNRRHFQQPDDIGMIELVLFALLPLGPTAIGAQGAVIANVATVAMINVVLLAVTYLVTRWALIPMVIWSLSQVWQRLGDVSSLAMKSLPTMVLFSAFIFLNAEMWQVANDFTLPYFALVIALLASVGGAFVAVSVRRLTLDLVRFANWREIAGLVSDSPVADIVPDDHMSPPPANAPLGRGASFNVGLLLFVSQAVQIMLVALVITVFYVIFGMLTVREATLLQWTTASELTSSADWAVRIHLLGSEVLFSRELVVVAGFIGVISSLQFAVQLVTDESYRAGFAADMADEVREALAVRAVYLRKLVRAPAAT